MYIGTTIIEFDLELTENEAVSIISWNNDILKGQEKCGHIQSDLDKIWDGEEVLMGGFYKNESTESLYYYVHKWHKTYSSMTMSYVATFSKVDQHMDLVKPCADLDHQYQHEAYLPYIYDFMMLQQFSLDSDLLDKLKEDKDIKDISSLEPPTEDEWTRRLAFGLNRNNIPCVCMAGLRNREVSSSWSHILPNSVYSGFLAFQGAPDIIINKIDALSTHREQDDGDEEQFDDDENSQHSGRIQVGHQMASLKPKSAGSLLYKKIGELVGALHTSLACRAINKYLNGENVQSLTAHGLHVHRSHRVYHMSVTLGKSTLLINVTLLLSGLLNERTMCSIMKYYCDHRISVGPS